MSVNKFAKIGLIVLLGVSFSGCTTKLNYQSQTLTEPSEKYTIDIQMKQTHNVGILLNSSIKNVLTLYINDEIALKGSLEADTTGEFQSMYDGKKLTVKCGKDTIFSKTTCLVHLGNRRMGNFELNIKN